MENEAFIERNKSILGQIGKDINQLEQKKNDSED
jgi:hypothetical protein